MTDIVQWVATAATILAALITASNLGARITGYGFCVFLVGSIAWLATGVMTGQSALIATNAILTGLNAFGIWRWLGRESKVEEGGRSAAEESKRTPGEKLFPVSLLTSAGLASGGEDLGTCVDAMVGCNSGRVHYLVVSEGGVAGVGETLRRLDWPSVSVTGNTVQAKLEPGGLDRLPELERDHWPGR